MMQGYKHLPYGQLSGIKKGDVIERRIAFMVPSYVTVVDITPVTIKCDPWAFDRDSGLEIDEDIFCVISYIGKVLTKEEKQIIKEKGQL